MSVAPKRFTHQRSQSFNFVSSLGASLHPKVQNKRSTSSMKQHISGKTKQAISNTKNSDKSVGLVGNQGNSSSRRNSKSSILKVKTQNLVEKTKNTIKKLSFFKKSSKSLHAKESQDLEKELNSSIATEETFQKVLSEVIRLSEYGPAVSVIKDKYEEAIAGLKKHPVYEETEKLRENLQILQDKKIKIARENEHLLQRFGTVSKANAERCRVIDSLEDKYTQHQKKFWDYSDLHKKSMPTDETGWQFFIAEHKNSYNMHKQYTADLETVKYDEKKLFRLLKALQQRGYVLEKEPEKSYDSVEFTNIDDQSFKKAEKPGNVPALSLLKVEPNSVSSFSMLESEEQ